MGNLRHAEKHRVSTCRFADDVARAAVERFRNLCVERNGVPVKIADIPYLHDGLRCQTVLAAVVASIVRTVPVSTSAGESLRTVEELRIVSLGVGTKVVSDEDESEDEARGVILRDNHAEVLARRGFLRVLYSQLESLLAREESTGDTRDAASWVFERVSDVQQKRRVKLRDNVFFHLYTSSAPCGNACVRRWAKTKKEVMDVENDGDAAPLTWRKYAQHPRFHFICPEQIAVTRKSFATRRLVRSELDRKREETHDANEEEEEETSKKKKTRVVNDGEGEEEETSETRDANATTKVSSHVSCSDKIARWVLIGLEGALLRSVMGERVPLSSVVIGRKFCRPHAERALCCRLWKPLAERGLPHPSIMCTSVKLEEGAFPADTGARFTSLALLWADDCEYAEVLDASTGRLVNPHDGTPLVDGNGLMGPPSSVSRAALLERWESLVERGGTTPQSSSRSNRLAGADVDFATRYRRAKSLPILESYRATLDELREKYLPVT